MKNPLCYNYASFRSVETAFLGIKILLHCLSSEGIIPTEKTLEIP